MLDQARLADLLLDWESARESGRLLAPEELCAGWPEGAQELRRRIGLLERLDPVLDLSGTAPADREPAANGHPHPPALPNYELLGELGRGGMGVVYTARDLRLGRLVAIKVLRPDTLTSRSRRRLALEGRVMALLRHQHIVPIYEAELAGDTPYLVMELVRGGNLVSQAGAFAGHPGRAAALVEQVALAVQHAHEHGVLHRDLKPGNILLDEAGRPLVGDFGLAKVVEGAGRSEDTSARPGAARAPDAGEEDVPITAAGTRPGTRRYMAPEQLLGEPEQVTPRTDVWAMGVILYELLTGRHPRELGDGRTLPEVAGDDRPLSPRLRCRGLGRGLEGIVLKCLEKDPVRRYATAVALADDLARWRRGEAPSVLREGPVRRSARWARRHPAVTTAAVLLLTFALALAAYRPPVPDAATATQWAEQRYRDAVRGPEKELARGRAATLIGPDTRQLPYRLRVGDGWVTIRGPQAADGPVLVGAAVPSVVEFLPDPQRSAYRLVVELRQDAIVQQNPSAEVAVAFAFSRHDSLQGPQCFFAGARFADLGYLARAYKTPAGRPASLFAPGFFHAGSATSRPYRGYFYRGAPQLVYPLEAPDAVPGPWRRLEVEVRPEMYRAVWDGQALPPLAAAEGPMAVAAMRSMYPDLEGVHPGLSPRGALGLYLVGCTVSVRRFVVEPLPD